VTVLRGRERSTGRLVEFQIARLGGAMIMARTIKMEGDLHAMDRLIKLTSEFDRHHDVGKSPDSLSPEGSPGRLLAGR
jgi:hypothetical protein